MFLTPCEAYEISAVDLRRILNEMPHVSDVLLRAFLMRRELLEEAGFTGVRVVGSRYSRDTHRIREFLARNRVPSTWIDLEKDPGVDQLLMRFCVTADDMPVVCAAMSRSPAILPMPSWPTASASDGPSMKWSMIS